MRAPDPATRTVLIVANETLGGGGLLEAARDRAAEDVRFVLCVPLNRPRAGLVVYDDSVFDAAQVRLDLALEVLRDMGARAIGEVGDPDPYVATMDAVHEYHPSEIVISTFSETRSGWLRRDLVDRISEATQLPVTHVVYDEDEGEHLFHVTLAVATARPRATSCSRRSGGGPKSSPRRTSASCSLSSCPRRVERATPPGGRARG